MAEKLEGKIALVTGGSTGIGLATAQRFVAEGAFVFITGRRQEELDKAVQKIGSNVTGVQGDAGSMADLDVLFSKIKQDKGHLRHHLRQRRRWSICPTRVHYRRTVLVDF